MGRNSNLHALFQDENLPFVELAHKGDGSIRSEANDATSTNKDVRSDNNKSEWNASKACLREIVLPYFEEDETNLFLEKLAKPLNPRTQRPMTGLYQWPTTNTKESPIYIRPIPAGPEDQYLSPPSLVFQIPSPFLLSNDSSDNDNTSNIQLRRIGFNGNSSNKGQFILYHQSLSGIDVRLCPNTQLSTTFAEGEDALFAGSIDELQRTNSSLLPTTNTISASNPLTHTPTTINNNIDYSIPLEAEAEAEGDCWMEVRAMVKQYPNRLWEKYIFGNYDILKRRRRKGKNVSMLIQKSLNSDTKHNCSSSSAGCSVSGATCNGRIVKAPKVVFE